MASCVRSAAPGTHCVSRLLQESVTGSVSQTFRSLARWPHPRTATRSLRACCASVRQPDEFVACSSNQLMRRSSVAPEPRGVQDAGREARLGERHPPQGGNVPQADARAALSGALRRSVPRARHPVSSSHTSVFMALGDHSSAGSEAGHSQPCSPARALPRKAAQSSSSSQILRRQLPWRRGCLSGGPGGFLGTLHFPASPALRFFTSDAKKGGMKAPKKSAPEAPEKKDSKQAGKKKSHIQSEGPGNLDGTPQSACKARLVISNGWTGSAAPQSLTAAEQWEPSSLTLKQHQQVVMWKKARTCILCQKEVQGGSVEKLETACEKAWRFISGYSRNAHVCPILPQMRIMRYGELPLRERAKFDAKLRRE
ncbi:hypothetical protein BESB_049700 [Besnoitia besnoiti]|uniref:Uncharacterized protein n=1 Tax=Besnoitia besnoiti TaxID=94643 RepID=A0A2A9ME38_BESBE|nr:hypothetical protein BESB_049700 [Besnoitia besnoiti]PFH36778.1 hypothetical protein BESB_049700 [Besnoitia besnoiti]